MTTSEHGEGPLYNKDRDSVQHAPACVIALLPATAGE